ncbi:MAG TPA: nucleotidyltransferase family protein, partial [Oceanospirillales bacterium]|nr:nucleotidyltransferase family protein [Oceanospirillales bacterium]
MRALILAAGKGERMRPLTLVKPKPLLEVCGTSLIEHHIINLKKAGFTELVINTSWLSQQILQKLGSGKQYGVKIRYSFEGPEPLETGGGMYKALPLLGDKPFLVVNGDIKTDFDFKRIKISHNSLAHLVLVNNPEHNLQGDFAIDEQHRLSFINSGDKFTYSGIGIYDPSLFSSCTAGTFSVIPLLKDAMQKQLISGELYQGAWDDIGTIDRLTKIN